jgi:hypothetical protein
LASDDGIVRNLYQKENIMTQDIDKLQAEVTRLTHEVNRLRQEKSGKSKIGCWIGVAVAAVVAIPVLGIMAAIALPMYSTFKQKSRVASALKSASGSVPALMAWHDSAGTFENVTVAADGGSLRVGEERIGTGLPTIRGLLWRVASDETCLNIVFNWTKGCPPNSCDGIYQLCCEAGNCTVAISVGKDGALGFNQDPTPVAGN